MNIGGREISDKECDEALNMFRHDCEEVAGQFFDAERSETWRLNWQDQDEFVRCEWKTFAGEMRKEYGRLLGSKGEALNVSEKDKTTMLHAILILNHLQHLNAASGVESDTRLQLAPNTQAFIGDKAENRRTLETFGMTQSHRAWKRRLLNSIAGEIMG